MKQLPEAIERMLSRIEADNGGWLHGGKVPCRLNVLLDGYAMDAVVAVNRGQGIIEVGVSPLTITTRNGEPEILTYRLRGSVELEVLE